MAFLRKILGFQLGQLGLIVGLGVIVDTLVVRTVIVPAIFALFGDRIWWPSRAPGAALRGAAPRKSADQGAESEHGQQPREAALTR